MENIVTLAHRYRKNKRNSNCTRLLCVIQIKSIETNKYNKMKLYYLIGIVLAVLLTSCGNSKEKKETEKRNREIEAQRKKVQRTQDSIKYEQAIVLYNEQNWTEATEAFKSVRNTDFYRKQSLKYIEKIKNRPWKKSCGYLKTSTRGKFSNSATKDSPLWVEIEINNKGYIYLYIYEYSDYKPSNRSAEKPMYDFSIYVYERDGKSEFLCYEIRPNDSYEVSDATHSEGIRISGGLAKKVINTLKRSKKKVYFSITMGSSSTYEFNLSSEGFTKEYNSL